MATRIQVIVEEAEREAFRSVAEQEGLSLSAWLRQAGKDRLVAKTQQKTGYDAQECSYNFLAHSPRLRVTHECLLIPLTLLYLTS